VGDTYLSDLESESIEIIREVVATASRPVMLYSIGKDSSVMLRLAQKSFYPGPVPFPLLHIDTGWKFREMIAFRDRIAREAGVELLAYTNPRGATEGIGPASHGSAYHTDVMKTEALRQALDLHGFDVALGGARRDEEKSRAKERIFSFRAPGHRWDAKAQRPELWNLYNTRINAGETIRAFPLSNWTEADVWDYIRREDIPVVPLYFAAPRPVVRRLGQWIMVDDDRLPLEAGETPELRVVRFRTLGCYPLTAAIDSTATTIDAVVAETLGATTSERHGRAIDHDAAGSMERKKQEGYF
jgi:sulfate adenylyltransferase subunit 2